MATLKMQAGSRYMNSAIFGDRVIEKGETVEVSDEQANHLLTISYFDSSNNEHFYFLDVTDGEPTPVHKRVRVKKEVTKEEV